MDLRMGIRKVRGGYIVTLPKPGTGTEDVVCASFSEVVQLLALRAGERGIGKDWQAAALDGEGGSDGVILAALDGEGVGDGE